MSFMDHRYNPEPPSPEALANNGFWPDLDPADFRSAERVLESITPPRIDHALSVAMADINRQLRTWQAEKTANGAATIDDVKAPEWQAPSALSMLYRRAVYATAMASLLERYRQVSATTKGDERGEANREAADDYRRDARWAVAEIQDRNHAIVELI